MLHSIAQLVSVGNVLTVLGMAGITLFFGYLLDR